MKDFLNFIELNCDGSLFLEKLQGIIFIYMSFFRPPLLISLFFGFAQLVFCQHTIPEPPTANIFLREIAVFDSVNRHLTYPSDAVLFTGSSSIKLWKTISEDLPGIHCVNRGFGGSRIEDLAFFHSQVFSDHPWKGIVIMVGSNNLTGGIKDMSIDSILIYTRYIISQIREERPDVPVFWIAITPTWSRISAIDKIRRMNEAWKNEFAELPQTYFIDTFDRFIGSDGMPMHHLFVSDRLHLSREGYRIWGEVIGKSLEMNLRR